MVRPASTNLINYEVDYDVSLEKRNHFDSEIGIGLRWHADSPSLLTDGNRGFPGSRNEYFYNQAKWLSIRIWPDYMTFAKQDPPRWSIGTLWGGGQGQNFTTVPDMVYREDLPYDSRICAPLLEFVEIVYKNQLASFYGAADYYLYTIQNNIVAKWYLKEHRDGPEFKYGGRTPIDYGGWRSSSWGVRTTNYGLARVWSRLARISQDDLSRWSSVTLAHPSPFLPNVGQLAAFYDTTFQQMARSWITRPWVENDLYQWWDEFGFPGEFKIGFGENDMLHQGESISFMVEAYERGHVLRTEIERLARTFTNRMWNGQSGQNVHIRKYISGDDGAGDPVADNGYNGDYFLSLSSIDFRVWEIFNDWVTKWHSGYQFWGDVWGGWYYYHVYQAFLVYYVKYGIPRNFRVTQFAQGGTSVALSWQNPSDYPTSLERPDGTGLRYFNIYRREFGQPWSSTAYAQLSTSSHVFTDNVDPNKIIQYKIRSQDWTAAFTNESDDSPTITVHKGEVVDLIENGTNQSGNIVLANSLVIPAGNQLNIVSATTFSALPGVIKNIWLYGTIHALQNSSITIGNSVSLRAEPNSTILYASGGVLQVDGALLASGTAGNPVTSTGTNIIGAASATISLGYTNISNASTAITAPGGAGLTVSNCNFTNCSIAINITTPPTESNTPMQITSNTLSNFPIGCMGIAVDNYSNVLLADNTLTGPVVKGTGIFCNASSPLLLRNTVQSFKIGMSFANGSSAMLQDGQIGGYNIVSNNTTAIACDASDAILGFFETGGEEGGQNTICDNSAADVNINSSAVLAYNNRWQSDGEPPGAFIVTNGVIKYDPWLHDPCSGTAPIAHPPLAENPLAGGKQEEEVNDGGDPIMTPVPALIIQALRERQRGNHLQADALLRAIVANGSITRQWKEWGLGQLLAVGQRMRQPNFADYFAAVAGSQPQLARQARGLLPSALVREGLLTQAIAAYDANIRQYPNSNIERFALYGQFSYQLFNRRDTTRARALLNRLAASYAQSIETEIAEVQMSSFHLSSSPSSNPTGEIAKSMSANSTTSSLRSIPTAFALSQNYPNPFNPTTTIAFALPEPSYVSLVVYDVLGRKVAELENGTKDAGYHSAVWNAGEAASGVGYASGVYFARFFAMDANGNIKLSKVNKLLLAK